MDEADLMAMLKELIAAQLVVEETADHFAFRHALTREAIYTTLLLRERQALHRSGGGSHGASVRSLHSSTPCRSVLSLLHRRGVGKSIALLTTERGNGRGGCIPNAKPSSITHAPWWQPVISTQVVETELLSARGHAYRILGDFRSALDDFEQARKIAQEQQNGKAEWRALNDLGTFWTGRNYQRTGEFFRQAEELARKLNEPKLIALSLNNMGNWFFVTGQTTQALKCHRQALEFFEGEQDEQGMAQTSLPIWEWQTCIMEIKSVLMKSTGMPSGSFENWMINMS